jgi:tetraacyldisaccharide 4'-kinase
MQNSRKIQRPWLLFLSPFYWAGVKIRNFLFDHYILSSTSFPLPLISVGNITVGGTGKTPMVEMLIRLLQHDYRLAVLSRGYKRKTTDFRLVSVRSGLFTVGDEPLQIKLKFPGTLVAVDRDRVHGVEQMIGLRHPPEVILLDDAFQHRSITPGLSILLVDYTRPVFRDCLLPAGNLREPWKNSKRADIIVVTKCPVKMLRIEREQFETLLKLGPKQQLFFTTYSYEQPKPVFPRKKGGNEFLTYKQLRKNGAGIILVTGIANPLPVFHFLREILTVDDTLFFPDHHAFLPEDIQRIEDKLRSLDTIEKYILVTEKDAVRLRELDLGSRLKRSLYYIPVEIKFLTKGEKPFIKRIGRYLKKAGPK